MIGVSLARVEVNCLGHGKQRQKDETQARNNRQETVPGATSGRGMCLKGCQPRNLAVLILQENAVILTRNRSAGCLKPMAFVTMRMPGVRVRLSCNHPIALLPSGRQAARNSFNECLAFSQQSKVAFAEPAPIAFVNL